MTESGEASCRTCVGSVPPQLGQIIKRAARNNERFLVDRRGQPSVMIMSVKAYIETIAPAPDWRRAVWVEAKREGLNKLTMRETNGEIPAYRQEKRAR